MNTYRMEIDLSIAAGFDIQNKLIALYKDQYEGFVAYEVADRRVGQNRNGPLFVHDGITFYLRQNKFNRAVLTVRDTNRYDRPEGLQRTQKS